MQTLMTSCLICAPSLPVAPPSSPSLPPPPSVVVVVVVLTVREPCVILVVLHVSVEEPIAEVRQRLLKRGLLIGKGGRGRVQGSGRVGTVDTHHRSETSTPLGISP